jgi:hypothetical protein
MATRTSRGWRRPVAYATVALVVVRRAGFALVERVVFRAVDFFAAFFLGERFAAAVFPLALRALVVVRDFFAAFFVAAILWLLLLGICSHKAAGVS